MKDAIELLQQLRTDSGSEVKKAFSAPYFEFKREDTLKLPLPGYGEAEAEFRLPYSSVVAELDCVHGGLLALSDLPGRPAVGLLSPRRFFLVLPLPGLPFLVLGGYLGSVDALMPVLAAEQGEEAADQFAEAVVANLPEGEEIGCRVVITSMSSFASRQPDSEQLQQLAEFTETAVISVLQCFARLMSPRVAVMESAPVALSGNKTGGKKLGSKQRIKRYTLVDVREVGRFLSGAVAATDKQATERAATLRRGCYHVLRHEKYARDESGQPRRVWCKPCWVGPESAVIEARRYRVLLNLDYQKEQKTEVVDSL